MRRIRVTTALIVIASFSLPAIGLAKTKNYCINFNAAPGQVLLVGQGFSLPSKGKCKAWQGSVSGSAATFNFPIGGNGCTSSDGTNFSLTVTGANQQNGGFALIGSVSLDLPAQTGTFQEQDLEGNSEITQSPTDVTGRACSPATIPAVTTSPASTQQASPKIGILGLP
jgi:hypothetical protein